jgi:aspartate carbamoyltransferase regulatory subunit
MARIFEVQYSFKCPVSECLKQNAHTIAITAEISSDARELAVADLSCEHCHKDLPKGYFVHTTITEVKS